MDARIDARKKEFKKTLDDPRRKREDEQVQIRRVNREAHLSKKRQQAAEGFTGTPSTQGPPVDVRELPKLTQWLLSADTSLQFQAAQQIRRMLSVENYPPIREVVDAGVVPRFVEFLMRDEEPALQFESAWALTNIASGSSEETASLVEANAIPQFVRLLTSPKPEVREQAVWALGNIAGDSPEYRNLVLSAGALAPLLAELSSQELHDSRRASMIRYGTWTLSNFCRGKPEPAFAVVAPALPVLRQLIYASDTDVLTDACWAISYLSDSTDDRTNKCIDEVIHAGVCPRLVELLGHSSFLVQTPALRAVGNIVTGDDMQTQQIIAQGALPKLKALLQSPRKGIKKEACWAISNITAGNKDQIEEVLNCGIIKDLVQLLTHAEFEVKREAAWAISNASSGGNMRQVEALVNSGCMKPLCDLLDVNDVKLVNVALEAIENILKTGKARQEQEGLPENPYVQKLEEADGFAKLEKLQCLPENSKVHMFVVKIMQDYLDIEAEDSIDFDAKDKDEFMFS
eukprot:Gregarina_sp_Poly_1__9694@NODE_615_length_7127_cov_142_509207_g471_i0_p2_GENE_NODE_615_length_7127_cov_142_509207_g471_i0NODE_615_length_7127_cov_142_509207_g471_i0_p2_ORF_typecomplete_len534_score114_05Arm/PF00514_23/1_4e02Arm/PF00514_23/6_3e10Arm/PF00514_23/3_5e13Arm/PF00514_23/0_00028Arm/PF00514_23/1_9e07Arm/PF00514_23/2_6e09Arm/PF00514_23/1_2e13Arm/PF00514_23/8_6e11Arm/PF00514_23/0_00013Arm_2/PF04826_13/1_2e08Arm_2/PF04826_13/2_5e08Arm_2/PF04826_13/1_3e10HEAT_2/PF13646_6/0_0042HEAT_2/PF13646